MSRWPNLSKRRIAGLATKQMPANPRNRDSNFREESLAKTLPKSTQHTTLTLFVCRSRLFSSSLVMVTVVMGMGDEKATTTPAFSFSSSSDRKKRQSSKRRPHSWASLSSLPTPAISTGAGSRSSQSSSAFLLADDTSTFVNDVARVYGADTDPVTFEPVVDVPALWTTVVVLGGALLLRLRQSAIAEAAETRASALEHLRTAKAKELGNEASPGEVRRAVRSYRAALDEEERLRTLLPGIRLRAPNNPQKSELDRQGGVAR